MEFSSIYKQFVVQDLYGYTIPGLIISLSIYINLNLFNIYLSKEIQFFSVSNDAIIIIIQVILFISVSYIIGYFVSIISNPIPQYNSYYHYNIILNKSKPTLIRKKFIENVNSLKIFEEKLHLEKDISIDKLSELSKIIPNTIPKFPDFIQLRILRGLALALFAERTSISLIISSLIFIPLALNGRINLFITEFNSNIGDILLVLILFFAGIILTRSAIYRNNINVSNHIYAFKLYDQYN